MAVASFGATTTYINNILNTNKINRDFTLVLQGNETRNPNLGNGPLIGSPGLPTPTNTTTSTSNVVYRGKVGLVYVYSVGSPPGGGATEITVVGTY